MADEHTSGDDPILNTTVAGRYEVYAKLGEGGMGAVYAARQAPLGRTVALKVLLRQLSEDPIAIKRFEKEALAISRLAHPNTVTIFDFGRTEAGLMYIAMEFMEGRTLRQAIEVEAPLETRRAVRILAQIARALSEAHLRGVIHRDLKPDNIMLVPTAGEPDFVKVLDFGVAKLRAQQGVDVKTLTQGDVIFGTPRYMSPEQVNGVMDDLRSDLYAVGAIAYEMLAGCAVFDADSAMKILMAHLQQAPCPFGELPTPVQVPAPLEQLVMRLLDKDPDDRFQSSDELLAALDELPHVGGGLRPPSGKTEGLPRDLAAEAAAAAKGPGTQMMGSNFSPKAGEPAVAQADVATEAYVDGPPSVAQAEAVMGSDAVAEPSVPEEISSTQAMPVSTGEGESPAPRRRSLIPILLVLVLLFVVVAIAIPSIDLGGGGGDDPLDQPAIPTEVVLTVQTDPPGASVLIDAVEVGVSPLSHTVATQRQHEVEARLEGYQPLIKRVTIDKDESITVLLTALTRDAAPAVADAGPVKRPPRRRDAGVAAIKQRDAAKGVDRKPPPARKIDAGPAAKPPPVDFDKWDDLKDPTGAAKKPGK